MDTLAQIQISNEIEDKKPPMRWGKYLLVFIITTAIFGTAIIASDFLYRRRLKEIDTITSRISTNLLSSEVQFDLLSEAPCEDISSPILTDEINTLATQLEFLEGSRGSNGKEVVLVKERYSLLQIKDLLLIKEITKRCGGKAYTVVYFYSNTKGACAECEKQGFVLSALREKYSQLKIYSFDYDLSLGGLTALKRIYSLDDNLAGAALPVIVIDRKVYHGFKSIEDLEKFLPGISTTTLKVKNTK